MYADLALREGDRARQQRNIVRAHQYAALARGIGLGAQQLAPLEDDLRRLDVERPAGKDQVEPDLASR